jgi:hypothetical protein
MKYLFTSLHLGPSGEEIYIEQTPEDKSTISIDPPRSCFFDVQEQERQGNKCVMFCMVGENNTYLVDLRTGRFEVNGASFYLHKGEVGNIRVIYFRDMIRNFTMDGHGLDQYIDAYNFGWQGQVDGKNVQYIITLK